MKGRLREAFEKRRRSSSYSVPITQVCHVPVGFTLITLSSQIIESEADHIPLHTPSCFQIEMNASKNSIRSIKRGIRQTRTIITPPVINFV